MNISNEIKESFWLWIANHLPRLTFFHHYRARCIRLAGAGLGNRVRIWNNFDIRPIGFASNLIIGDETFINANFTCAVPRNNYIKIGRNCAIGPNVSMECVNHSLQWNIEDRWEVFVNPILVGDRVWIGARSVILGGVTIASDSVVAAGSVVNKDVPSKVLVAGAPAKVVKEIS